MVGESYLSGVTSLGSSFLSSLGGAAYGAASSAANMGSSLLSSSYSAGAGAGGYLSSLLQAPPQSQMMSTYQPSQQSSIPSYRPSSAPSSALGSFGSSFNLGALTGSSPQPSQPSTSSMLSSFFAQSPMQRSVEPSTSITQRLTQPSSPSQSLDIGGALASFNEKVSNLLVPHAQAAEGPVTITTFGGQPVQPPQRTDAIGNLTAAATIRPPETFTPTGTTPGKMEIDLSGAGSFIGDKLSGLVSTVKTELTKAPEYRSPPPEFARKKETGMPFDLSGSFVSKQQPPTTITSPATSGVKDVDLSKYSSAVASGIGTIGGGIASFFSTESAKKGVPSVSGAIPGGKTYIPETGATSLGRLMTPGKPSDAVATTPQPSGKTQDTSAGTGRVGTTATFIPPEPSKPTGTKVGGQTISYQGGVLTPSDEWASKNISGWESNLGDSKTKTLIGTVQKDPSGKEFTIDTTAQALEFQKQEALKGNNNRAATFYQNELDKDMQNRVRLSSQFHHEAADTGKSIAYNPWENVGDAALAFLKAGGGDELKRSYGFNPDVSGERGVINMFPAGVGSQETSWNAAIARETPMPQVETRILKSDFQPAIAAVLGAATRAGPYGTLGGKTEAGAIEALPSGYQDLLGRMSKGETTQYKGGSYTIPESFIAKPEITTPSGSTFEATTGIPKPFVSGRVSDKQGGERLTGGKTIAGQFTRVSEPSEQPSAIDFLKGAVSVPIIPKATAAGEEGSLMEIGTISGGQFTPGYTPPSTTGVSTNGAAVAGAAGATGETSTTPAVNIYKLGINMPAPTGKVEGPLDIIGKGLMETGQQTAGFGLSVLDQIPLVGAPATDIILESGIGKAMGASKDVDRYGSYSRVTRRIGQELQKMSGVSAEDLRSTAEKKDTGLIEKFGYSAAASALENPGQIPSAIESGLLMGAGFGKLAQFASPYAARLGTAITGTGAGGTKAALALQSKYVPIGLMGAGMAYEGTEGLTQFEPGKIAINLGTSFPTAATQIAAMSAQEPLLRLAAKQTMLRNAIKPEEQEVARTLINLESNVRGIKSPIEKVSEFDPSKVTNIKEPGVGQIIKERLQKEATLIFGGAGETQMPGTTFEIGGRKFAIRKGPTTEVSGTHDIDVMAISRRNPGEFSKSLADDLNAKYPNAGYTYEPGSGLIVDKTGAHIIDAHSLFGDAEEVGSLAMQIKSTPIAKLDYGLSEVAFTGPKGAQTATIPFRVQTLNKINSMFGAPVEGGGWRFGPAEHRMKDIGQGIVDAKFMAMTAREQAAVTKNPITKIDLTRRADQIDRDIDILIKNPLFKQAWDDYADTMALTGYQPRPPAGRPPTPSPKPGGPPVAPPTPQQQQKQPQPQTRPVPQPSVVPQPTVPNVPINVNIPASRVSELTSTVFAPTSAPSVLRGTAATEAEIAALPSVLTAQSFREIPTPSSQFVRTEMAPSPVNVNIPASRIAELKSQIRVSEPSKVPSIRSTVPISKSPSISAYISPMIKPSEPSSEKPSGEEPSSSEKPSEGKSSTPPSGSPSYGEGSSGYGSSYYGGYSYPSVEYPSYPPSSSSKPSSTSKPPSGGGIGYPIAPWLAPGGGGGGVGGGMPKRSGVVLNPLEGLSVAGKGTKFFDFQSINNFVRSVRGKTAYLNPNVASGMVAPAGAGAPSTIKAGSYASSLQEASNIVSPNMMIQTPQVQQVSRKRRNAQVSAKRTAVKMPKMKTPAMKFNLNISGDLGINSKKKSKKGRYK